MADKIYNGIIINISQIETTMPVSMYTCKLLLPNFINKHVLFTQNIFASMLLFLPMQSLFQKLLMRKLNYIQNNLWEKTSNRSTIITVIYVVMNVRLCEIILKLQRNHGA